MGISWKEFGKAWKAAGGDKLFLDAGLTKKELNQLKSNIRDSDLEDLGGDLTKYISGLSKSFNANTTAQRDIFISNRNAHTFTGISEDTLNSIQSANEERVLRAIDPEGYAARLRQQKAERVTESLQNSLKSNRDEYYSRQAEVQKNIQQDNLIRKLEGQRQYFENSHYSTSAEAASQANIEESSQRAINKQLTGSQEKVGISGNTAAAREEAEFRNGNSPEAQKLQQIFREREEAEAAAQRNVEQARSIGKRQFQNYQDFRSQKAAAANVESSSVSKATQDVYDNLRAMGETKQYASNPLNRQIANDLGVNPYTVEGKQLIEQTKNIGSGKSLKDAVSIPIEQQSDLAKGTGLSDFVFKGTKTQDGKSLVDNTLSLDRAIWQQKLGGDQSTWGYKGAEKRILDSIEKESQKLYSNLQKNEGKMTQQEIQKAWDEHRNKVKERLSNGPTYGDYIIGNELHTGAIGMAAITGTMGAAFGGHKSNAELYSSPF